MKTYVHLRECLGEFFIEWEVFKTKVVEKIKNQNTYFMFRNFHAPPPSRLENRALYEIIWKNIL